jgi:hypothetical protein
MLPEKHGPIVHFAIKSACLIPAFHLRADFLKHRSLGGRMMGPKHTPSDWTFWLLVALVVLAIVSAFVKIPYVSTYALWVAVIGYVILVIGCTVKTT